jgi:hypothetical protein
MEIWLHFVQELIADNRIKPKYIWTRKNYTDFLTKPTGHSNIQQTLKAIGVGTTAFNASSLAAWGPSSCQIMMSAQAGAKWHCKEETRWTAYNAKQHKPLDPPHDICC